jgi:outer membrane biosynthesis protein TonB
MYFDFEDHRPDVPRVPSAISVHAGVLVSLGAHVGVAALILFTPLHWFERPVIAEPVAQRVDPESVRFVEMRPLRDRSALPRRPAEQSDMDRRSATRERAPNPANAMPFSRGDTPEKIEDGRVTEGVAEEPLPASPSGESAGSPPVQPPDVASRLTPEAAPRPAPPAPVLGQAFRNLQRYLQDGTFDNQLGGETEQSADIQFDAKGADFGPWLRRFKNQVERNWMLPNAALGTRERSVVIQFSVLSNGTIIDLRVVQPADLEPLTTAALNALILSNPTAALPQDYPSDRVLITVTFRYILIRGT